MLSVANRMSGTRHDARFTIPATAAASGAIHAAARMRIARTIRSSLSRADRRLCPGPNCRCLFAGRATIDSGHSVAPVHPVCVAYPFGSCRL